LAGAPLFAADPLISFFGGAVPEEEVMSRRIATEVALFTTQREEKRYVKSDLLKIGLRA